MIDKGSTTKEACPAWMLISQDSPKIITCILRIIDKRPLLAANGRIWLLTGVDHWAVSRLITGCFGLI
jgi:hypothetical protein